MHYIAFTWKLQSRSYAPLATIPACSTTINPMGAFGPMQKLTVEFGLTAL
jgi:hypothetical protein